MHLWSNPGSGYCDECSINLQILKLEKKHSIVFDAHEEGFDFWFFKAVLKGGEVIESSGYGLLDTWNRLKSKLNGVL